MVYIRVSVKRFHVLVFEIPVKLKSIFLSTIKRCRFVSWPTVIYLQPLNVMFHDFQSRWGLCFFSHGIPNTTL